jgi:hypothetical protein
VIRKTKIRKTKRDLLLKYFQFKYCQLFFAISLMVILAATSSFFVQAAELCYFKGPDSTADSLASSNFAINGNSPLMAGDSVVLQFVLKNTGKETVILGSDGIFIRGKDSQSKEFSFGSSYSQAAIKPGEQLSFEKGFEVTGEGEWRFWPAYSVMLNGKEIKRDISAQTCIILAVRVEPTTPQTEEEGNKEQDEGEDELNEQEQNQQQNCQMDEDGCPDQKGSRPNLVLVQVPEIMVPGKRVSVSVRNTADVETKKIMLFANNVLVKNCSGSSCSYETLVPPGLGTILFGAIGIDEEGNADEVGGVMSMSGRTPDRCFDSDSGFEPYRRGDVSSGSPEREGDTIILPARHFDSCESESTLREYFCEGSGSEIMSRVYACSSSCYESPRLASPDGRSSIQVEGDACICSDSDGGIDFYTRGIIGRAETHEENLSEEDSFGRDEGSPSGIDEEITQDYCDDDNFILTEYYCEDNTLKTTTHPCHYGCMDGRCYCHDSDGGINFQILGRPRNAFNYPVGQLDECIDETTLREVYVEVRGAGEEAECVIDTMEHTCETECLHGTCLEPSCTDTIQNQGEEGVDCGGPCDACPTCDDGIMNQDELAIDCGGSCPSCPACIPIEINAADTDHAIDIVFIMDEDYSRRTDSFLRMARAMVDDGYFGDPVINGHRGVFNFYYMLEEGNYEEVCDHWTLPDNIDRDCSFRDMTAILHADAERDCAHGSVFSADAPGTAIHESGHSLFGFADEYCCDGGYSEGSEYPNIFSTQERCREYAEEQGFPGENCFNFCPAQKCWPGSEESITACEEFYRANGLDPLGCDCAAWAAANELDPEECTEEPEGCRSTFWNSIWERRGIASEELTVLSPNWCSYRGEGYRACCGEGWWKFNKDPLNPPNAGNCIMVGNGEWCEACEFAVNEMLEEIRG